MRWDCELASKKGFRTGGYYLLERHLARLRNSAFYFDFHFNEEAVLRELGKAAESFSPTGPARRVRLLLNRTGLISCESALLSGSSPALSPLKLSRAQSLKTELSPKRTNSSNFFLYHKTTKRSLYNEAIQSAREKGLFDYIFTNERGELTEGSITNLFVKSNNSNSLWTPPVSCGLLPGSLREELLQTGAAKEKILVPEDLTGAAIFLGNSVRGLVKLRIES